MLDALRNAGAAQLQALQADFDLSFRGLLDKFRDQVVGFDDVVLLIIVLQEFGQFHLVGEQSGLKGAHVLDTLFRNQVGEHECRLFAVLSHILQGHVNLLDFQPHLENLVVQGADLARRASIGVLKVEDVVLLLKLKEVVHRIIALLLDLLKLLAQHCLTCALQ